jgi:hypothetical protein
MDPENRRDFLRARVRFPAMSRVLTPQECEKIKNSPETRPHRRRAESNIFDELMEQIAPGAEQEPLFRCFQLINNKLDFIIDRLFSAEEDKREEFNEVIEISGSGLIFISRRTIPPDSLIKMDLIIPASLQFRIELILRVGRVQERQSERTGTVEYLIAGQFEEIDEESRESIVKAVFRSQRKLIRNSKMNRGNSDWKSI